MNDPVTPTVELIAYTAFVKPDVPWEPTDWNEEYEDALVPLSLTGQDLVEFAGRACYQSWNRPNPDTATNAGYLSHIIDVGHFSTFEHAYATFYITGVSRSLTHEFVRHRHFNYSQVSQRYVDAADSGLIVPPEFEDDDEFRGACKDAMASAVESYQALYDLAHRRLELAGVKGTEGRKRARQAARAAMPNMTETKIVVTGNYRAWRHFLDMRAAAPADVEIRRLAVEIGRQLTGVAPNAFQDFELVTLTDGTQALVRDTMLS